MIPYCIYNILIWFVSMLPSRYHFPTNTRCWYKINIMIRVPVLQTGDAFIQVGSPERNVKSKFDHQCNKIGHLLVVVGRNCSNSNSNTNDDISVDLHSGINENTRNDRYKRAFYFEYKWRNNEHTSNDKTDEHSVSDITVDENICSDNNKVDLNAPSIVRT